MKSSRIMPSAFSSNLQALLFFLFLLSLLSLPVILNKTGLLKRSDVYLTVPVRHGPFSYFHHQIFEEKSDVDILFLGSSVLWTAIDPEYVKNEIGKTISKEPVIFTIGSNWRGEDLLYVQLRDILDNRRVKVLIFSSPPKTPLNDMPHHQSYRWLTYGHFSDAMEGLPLKYRLSLYAEYVLGAPRHLLSFLRPELPASYEEDMKLSGAYKAGLNEEDKKASRNIPEPQSIPVEDMYYSPRRPGWFVFDGPELGSYQLHFLKEIARIVKKKDIRLVILNLPLLKDRKMPYVEERMFWPDIFGNDVVILGISPAVLFSGLDDKMIKSLYFNPNHFNFRGNEFFTKAIFPAIMRIYAETISQR